MGLLPARSGSLKFDGQEMVGLRSREARAPGPSATCRRGARSSRICRSKGEFARRARGERQAPLPEKTLHAVSGAAKDARAARRAICRAASNSSSRSRARASASDPKLIILDEPCEGIQPNIVHEIGDVNPELKRRGDRRAARSSRRLPFARRVARTFCMMDQRPHGRDRRHQRSQRRDRAAAPDRVSGSRAPLLPPKRNCPVEGPRPARRDLLRAWPIDARVTRVLRTIVPVRSVPCSWPPAAPHLRRAAPPAAPAQVQPTGAGRG